MCNSESDYPPYKRIYLSIGSLRNTDRPTSLRSPVTPIQIRDILTSKGPNIVFLFVYPHGFRSTDILKDVCQERVSCVRWVTYHVSCLWYNCNFGYRRRNSFEVVEEKFTKPN